MPYYDALIVDWIRETPESAQEFLDKRTEIHAAVKAGL
jgi:hypothetical protein